MDRSNRNWQKSSKCADAACVEVAFVDTDTILIRDGADPAGPVLSFTNAEWVAFVEGARLGEFRF